MSEKNGKQKNNIEVTEYHYQMGKHIYTLSKFYNTETGVTRYGATGHPFGLIEINRDRFELLRGTFVEIPKKKTRKRKKTQKQEETTK